MSQQQFFSYNPALYNLQQAQFLSMISLLNCQQGFKNSQMAKYLEMQAYNQQLQTKSMQPNQFIQYLKDVAYLQNLMRENNNIMQNKNGMNPLSCQSNTPSPILVKTKTNLQSFKLCKRRSSQMVQIDNKINSDSKQNPIYQQNSIYEQDTDCDMDLKKLQTPQKKICTNIIITHSNNKELKQQYTTNDNQLSTQDSSSSLSDFDHSTLKKPDTNQYPLSYFSNANIGQVLIGNTNSDSCGINQCQQKYTLSKSKFHNLSKLLLNTILKFFSKENLSKLDVPPDVINELIQVIHLVKQSGRKKSNNIYKTDLFNHSHYNLLFLCLNNKNINHFKLITKDAQLHKKCFNIDFSQPIDQHQINKINQIKQWIFKITMQMVEQSDYSEDSSLRAQYLSKALTGIKKLAAGIEVKRFQ